MKTKLCTRCNTEHTTLFRVQIEAGKTWVFVCENCILQTKMLPNYRYGGTWKGSRH